MAAIVLPMVTFILGSRRMRDKKPPAVWNETCADARVRLADGLGMPRRGTAFAAAAGAMAGSAGEATGVRRHDKE
jgi:hypothetical protein